MRLLTALFVALAAIPAAQAETLALVGATVYPSPDAPAIAHGTVLVRDGRIAAVGRDVRVPKGATVIDATGKVVVAGFWNSHVHLLPPAYRGAATQPAAVLSDALASNFSQWGFTTVFDIASLPGDAVALRGRIARGEVAEPQILTVDAPFFPEGGTPIYVKGLLDQLKVPSFEVATADAAATRAARQLEAGADGVKLFAGAIVGGNVGVLPMKPDVARAVVDVAHRRGKSAFAHPTNEAGLRVALDSGVDILAHTTPTIGPWPDATFNAAVTRHMALIPTLALIDTEAGAEGVPLAIRERMRASAAAQTKRFADAGGQILFGTDCGYTDAFDPLLEYRRMADAGLDWRAILASLTTSPSSRFGQAARKGRVAVGMDADLVVLDGDPAADVTAFDRVRLTLREGRILHRAPSTR